MAVSSTMLTANEKAHAATTPTPGQLGEGHRLARPARRRRNAQPLQVDEQLLRRLIAELRVLVERFHDDGFQTRRDRALRAARHGRRLGLVAADGYRVGAVEQLRLYADIIGTSFRVVRAADERWAHPRRAAGP